MVGKGIRARLVADQDLGAGNALPTLLAHGVDPQQRTLTFDTDVDGVPALHAFTLGELDRAVAARAAWFHARGIRAKDPVAVYSKTAADHMLGFLALIRLGAIPALVNGNIPAPLAADYIHRLGAVGYLADAEHSGDLEPHEPGIEYLGTPDDTAQGRPEDAPPPYRHHPEDPIAITHSSGTTGYPKAVASSHASLFAAIRHRLSMPRAQGADRILTGLPAAHNATLTALNLTLCNQGEVMFSSHQDGSAILEAIDRYQPRMVLGFAVTWSELARADLSAHDVSSVSVWWNTGDCAHEAHIRRLVKVGSHGAASSEGIVRRTGSMFVDGLGSTELGHSQFHITHREGTEHYDRCIGRPHLFAQARVVGPDGAELPPGVVGQLAVKSPTLSPGYWNDSTATYRARQDGWYLPSELVYRDDEGFYYHVDRAADAIDLGDGDFVYTSLSEDRILARCPEVLDCTVVALKQPGGVVTHILLRLAEKADPGADYTEAVKQALGNEKSAQTVQRVVVVPEESIPLGATGKVLKAVLRQRYAEEAVADPH